MAAGDPRFFARSGPHTLAVVAQAAAARVGAGADPDRPLHGIAPLQSAGRSEVSFLDNRKYLSALRATGAGAVLITEALAGDVPDCCVALVTAKPYEAWALVGALFHPEPPAVPGIHPTAHVEPGAEVDPSAEVDAFALVGAGAVIGPRCRIAPHAMVGRGVVMGEACMIGPHVSLSHAVLGRGVVLHAGARVGQPGFGFAITETGFKPVPQLGRVIIEDHVDVGANTTIDRGSAQDTVIGAGSRLDNLVQIAHNVRLGRACVVVAQAGISGSTVLGDFVMVGGQAGLIGHLTIGAGARIGSQAGVMGDVPTGLTVLGSPAMPGREALRQTAVLRRLVREREERRTKADAT